MKPKFFIRNGALMCDREIDGLTQDLAISAHYSKDCQEFYGGRYFICETITKTAAMRICEALKGEWTL